MSTYTPLQYRISSWDQLVECQSNHSRKLSIGVSKFGNNDVLNGTRIAVNHCDFGTLFACVVGATGSLVDPTGQEIINDLSNEAILGELAKYGFYVVYDPVKDLSASQIEYLRTLKGLNYDKIRVMSIPDTKYNRFRWYVVAFRSSYNSNWLNGWYSASEQEFTNALFTGNAVNASMISKECHYDWSWLYGWIGDIDDILEEHDAEDEPDEPSAPEEEQ